MPARSRGLAALTAAVTALALAGCATGGTDTSDGAIEIVASTDVYGDIASAIAGDRADVTSIISGSAQDPHSYEATARDQLALSRADLVIENGGGFDPFIDTLLDALDGDAPVVLTATDISGLFGDDEAHDHGHGPHEDGHAEDEHAEEDHAEDEHAEDEHAEDEHAEDDGHDHADGVNEHVWYSFEAMGAVADEIAHHLAEIDPAGADQYDANLAAFTGELDALVTRTDELRAEHEGDAVAVTEPAPLLLFEAMGMVNATPAEFSSAVENGTDVAPAVLLEMQRLIEGGTLALLAYNEQTSGAETEQVVALAEAEGLPLVTIAETLPEGTGYLDWMADTLDEIAAALR